MSTTYVTVTGNLTADPLQRRTQGGDSFVTFRLASTERRRQDDGSYQDVQTSYYNVVCYGALARNVTASLGRGMPVVVHGRQRVKEWRTDERSGTAVDVQATTVGPDLMRCHAAVRRGAAPQADHDPLSEEQIQRALAELDGRALDPTTGEVVDPADAALSGSAPDVTSDATPDVTPIAVPAGRPGRADSWGTDAGQ